MRLKIDFFEAESYENFDYLNVDYMGFPLKSGLKSSVNFKKVYFTHLHDVSVADFEWQIQKNKVKYLQIPSVNYDLDFLKYLNAKGVRFFFDRITYNTDSNIDFIQAVLDDFPRNFDYRVIIDLFPDFVNPWTCESSEYVNEKFYEIKKILEKDFVYTSVSSDFFETSLADRRVILNGLNITIAKDVTSTPVNSMKITDARIAINKLIV